jgi:hypothetical protein
VQGQAHTATQTETQTAAATTTTTTTTTGFAVGLQRAVLGWGRHDGCLCRLCCLCSAASTASTLLPGHASACNVDGDQASRGLPAGSAAKATCLESLLAQPPLASLPAGGLGTTHALRTTHCTALRTAWSGDFRLVGVVALNQVPVAGVAGVAGRGARAMAVARAPLTRAQRHPGPCWIIAGPCRELSSTLFQPRRPSERAGWQPDGERLTDGLLPRRLPCRILLPSPGVRGVGPVSNAFHWIHGSRIPW